MKSPPRFRLRTLLIAVAIAGLACGGEAMRRRRGKFMATAKSYAIRERLYRDIVALEEDDIAHFTEETDEGWREHLTYEVELDRGRAERARRSRAIYERAARYPWLPVPPDPPEPE